MPVIAVVNFEMVGGGANAEDSESVEYVSTHSALLPCIISRMLPLRLMMVLNFEGR
jgi:hypothetical protein